VLGCAPLLSSRASPQATREKGIFAGTPP